jgi:hypothetical protein
MIRIDTVMGHIGGQYGGQTVRKLDQLDSRCGGETGDLGVCHYATPSRGYKLQDVFGDERLRELQDQRGCCAVGTYGQGSLLRYDEVWYFWPAKRNKFRKASIVKSLDGQNEQSFAECVDPNGS